MPKHFLWLPQFSTNVRSHEAGKNASSIFAQRGLLVAYGRLSARGSIDVQQLPTSQQYLPHLPYPSWKQGNGASTVFFDMVMRASKTENVTRRQGRRIVNRTEANRALSVLRRINRQAFWMRWEQTWGRDGGAGRRCRK